MPTYPDRSGLPFRLSGKLTRLALGLVLLGGCAARPPVRATPLQTLVRYREALERDDPKAAYALLSQAAAQALPYEQFAQQWQDTKEERRAQAGQLQQVLASGFPGAAAGPAPETAASLVARAVVTLPQGAQLMLEPAPAARFVQGKPSAWRILDPDLQVIRAQTPEAVLRLLLAAAEQRNYPALLRLLTKGERQSLEAELAERLERLRSHLSRRPSAGTPSAGTPPAGTAPVETTGDRARLQYDPRFFIDLKREPEGWRIADFN